MDALAFIADLAASLTHAHSARRVVEVVFAQLGARTPPALITEVVLWYATGEGRGLEVTCTSSGCRIVPSVVPARSAPHFVTTPLPDDGGTLAIRGPRNALDREMLRALAALVASSMRHVEVLDRVAKLSRRAHVEARDLRERLALAERDADVIAASPSTKRIFREIVPAVARHDTTVLLRGPTGTGKEVVARRIHALSSRKSRSFVQINCGAIPASLVESTLFGHERGAFTGAVARHVGVFERAHLGTLLLDEIGDLPAPAQVKLLRVLQSGEIERVGGGTARVDVRVIAATNRPLEAMVAARAFREDLYYRLSVFPIELSPLCERPEDLDALTTAIVARGAARMGRPAPAVPESVRRKLRRHTWPGNVRELENVLERALVLCTNNTLDLPFALASATAGIAPAPAQVEPLVASTKRAIERALSTSRGRIYGPGGAAALLGLKPSTLQSKMQKLGVERVSPG